MGNDQYSRGSQSSDLESYFASSLSDEVILLFVFERCRAHSRFVVTVPRLHLSCYDKLKDRKCINKLGCNGKQLLGLTRG